MRQSNAVGYPRGLTREEVPISVVRDAFAQADVSVRELARRLGLHHSGVGRVVRGWKASQYVENADGVRIDYEARNLSMSRERAIDYLRAMDHRPEEWL